MTSSSELLSPCKLPLPFNHPCKPLQGIHTNPLSFVNATFFTHQPNNVAGKKGTESCQATGSSHAKISRMYRTYCYKYIMKYDTLYIYIHHFINNVVYMTTTTTLFVPFFKIIYKINNRMRRN